MLIGAKDKSAHLRLLLCITLLTRRIGIIIGLLFVVDSDAWVTLPWKKPYRNSEIYGSNSRNP